MATTQPPLNYEASATATHPHVSQNLPPEVVTCLKNARFLHLATCSPHPTSPIPHVSLMNYTYLPSTPFPALPGPIIIMTTNPASRKTSNLLSNPRVSLLVHDWVSHRPPTRSQPTDPSLTRDGSPPPAATRSSLASLLLNLNTSAMSSISTTIDGSAEFLQRESEEERWCKDRHLANNTFGEEEGGAVENGAARLFGTSPNESRLTRVESNGEGDGGRTCFIEGEDVRVVVVKIREGRIADWKGGVRDWALDEASKDVDQLGDSRGRRDDGLVNGVLG